LINGTHVISGDCASGISRDKFDLHVNLPIEILVLGLKARARGTVKGQSKKLTIVQNLTSAISPSDINILVQVASIGNQ